MRAEFSLAETGPLEHFAYQRFLRIEVIIDRRELTFFAPWR